MKNKVMKAVYRYILLPIFFISEANISLLNVMEMVQWDIRKYHGVKDRLASQRQLLINKQTKQTEERDTTIDSNSNITLADFSSFPPSFLWY